MEEIIAAKNIISTGYDNLVQVLEEKTIQLNRKGWAVCLDEDGNTAFLNVATGDLLLNGDMKVLWQQKHRKGQQSNTKRNM